MTELIRALEFEVETYQQTIRQLTVRVAAEEFKSAENEAQYKATEQELKAKIEELSLSCLRSVKQLQAMETDKAEVIDKLGKKTVECRDLRNERDELQRKNIRRLIITEYLAKTFRKNKASKASIFKVPQPSNGKISNANLSFSMDDEFETIIECIESLYTDLADFELEALLLKV